MLEVDGRGPSSTVRGRLAPSPTGYAHLGNAWAFLLAWCAVRVKGGSLIMRLEDIDPQRSRPEFATAMIEDLQYLGLDWDEGPGATGAAIPNTADTCEPGPAMQTMAATHTCKPIQIYEQSQRTKYYTDALTQLDHDGLIYPCFCTHKELRTLAAAPHSDDTNASYPGICRNMSQAARKAALQGGRKAALRLRCPETTICFTDAVQGPQCFSPAQWGGDFALRRSDGVTAYQLAVAVDDGLMQITQVVRGRDILPSTPRQILLLRALGLGVPEYAHIPLLLDAEGNRLAKRHQSLTLRNLWQRGIQAERVTGFLGYLAGLNPSGHDCRPADLLPAFNLAQLPRSDLRLDDDLMDRFFTV